MKIKPFTYFLCAIALVLIILSPLMILSYYNQMPETKTYKGMLTLWHISDWRTGGSSGASFIKKRVSEFESKNPHVFIKTISMTTSEANEEISSGSFPDIVSYPNGFQISMPLSSLPPKDNNPFIVQTKGLSYPFMLGGYCIIVNVDMLDEQGYFSSNSWGLRPDELLSAAQFGLCFDAEQGYSSLPAIAAHKYPDAQRPNISTWGEAAVGDAALGLSVSSYSDGQKAFCEGQSCVLIASHRQLFEINRLYEQNEAPAFLSYAIGGYTDMAQLISTVKCEDKLKQNMCASFAEYLVSEKAQKKLYALGVFPVIKNLNIYEDDECLNAMYSLLCDNALLTEQNDIQILNELAQKSFSGDAKALRNLRRLLK